MIQGYVWIVVALPGENKKQKALKRESLDSAPVLQDQALGGAEDHRRLPEYLEIQQKKKKTCENNKLGDYYKHARTYANGSKLFPNDCECTLVIHDHHVRNSLVTPRIRVNKATCF